MAVAQATSHSCPLLALLGCQRLLQQADWRDYVTVSALDTVTSVALGMILLGWFPDMDI